MAHVEWFERSDGTRVEVALTVLEDGDFHIDGERVALNERRASVMEGNWAVVRQVHGSTVVDASRTMLVPDADGIVTERLDQPIAVHGADCAPVAFVTASGPIGVAHIGWRGLAGGIVESMADTLQEAGAEVEHVLVGSCIGPECYEFGSSELEDLVARFGNSVKGRTRGGAPALDLRAGIASAAEAAGLQAIRNIGGCTSCDEWGFSHRARGDTGRHALVARITRNDF